MPVLSDAIKAAVRIRARGYCEYCRCPEDYATQAHSIEHIVPRVADGTDEPENLALACQGCNNHKFAKTECLDSLSGETAPLFHPRQMDWHEHFAWSDDYCDVLPMTATGRVTVRELCLNRTGLRNLRRILLASAEHPPA